MSLIFGDVNSDPLKPDEEMLELACRPSDSEKLAQILRDCQSAVNRFYAIRCERDDLMCTTLLYTAARSNNAAAVRVLLALRAEPNVSVQYGNTPLHVASCRGYVEIVEALIDARADQSLHNDMGETCTDYFLPDVSSTDREKILRLCRPGARGAGEEPKLTLEQEFVRVSAALESGEPSAALTALEASLKRLPDLKDCVCDNAGGHRTSLLYSAARLGNLPAVNLLVAAGADPNVRPYRGNSPLLVAAFRGHTAVVVALLKRGADADARNDDREGLVLTEALAVEAAQDPAIPLPVLRLWVVRCRSVQELNRLLDVGRGPREKSPLLVEAARANRLDAAALLLSAGADPDAADERGNRALHVSCYRGHVDMVRLLLQHGADLELVNGDGERVDQCFKEGVSDECCGQIQEEMRQARRARAQAAQQQQVDRYVQTLAARRISGSSVELEPVIQSLSMTPVTQTAVSRVLLGLLKQFVLETAEGEGRRIGNPVAAAMLLEGCTAAWDALWRARSWSDWLQVPLPELLPVTRAQVLDEVRKQCIQSPAEYLERMVGGLAPALAARMRAAIADRRDFEGAARKLFDCLLNAAEQTILSSGELGRIARSFMAQRVLKALADEVPDRNKHFRDCLLTKLAAGAQASAVLNAAVQRALVHVNAAKDYVEMILLAHSTHCDDTAVAQFIHRVAEDTQRSLSPASFLRRVDQYAEKYLLAAAEHATGEWVRRLEDGQLPTVQSFIRQRQEVLRRIIADGYGAPVAMLNPETNLLTIVLFNQEDLPYRQVVLERFFNDNDELRKFILAFKRPAACYQTCHDMFETFRNDLASQVRKRASFQDSIRHHLRPLHLHTLWCSMPCYAQLLSIDQEFTSHNVLLVQADTGSGKSVLIPQYIAHTNKDLHVYVTQPRREPTTSIGSHVQKQFGPKNVGFEVAGLPNPSPEAGLQYCTDGLLLERMFTSSTMQDWCVIIDEVHERSVNMDMLFLLALHRMRHGLGPRKLVLASAKVDAEWFKRSLECVNAAFPAAPGPRLNFGRLCVQVSSPFPVSTVAPPGGYLPWQPITPKQSATHARQAAQHALRIAGPDPLAKVLVFLTNPDEIRQAVAEFEKICGKGRISCGGIHAKAVGISGMLQQCRVLFSNNIAETSLTIPRLTHVVDFATCQRIEADRHLNCTELKADRCSSHAGLQRRGRLGRTAPGEYCAVHDPASLTAAESTSFEQLSNERLLRCEMRLRHFLRCTLFQGSLGGFQTLGQGLADPARVSRFVPPGKALEVGAVLNMTPGMAVALMRAVGQPAGRECALAILWLCAMLETREPPVPPRTPLPKEFMAGLGRGGDHGVLLQLFGTYAAAKAAAGFDLRAWCAQHGGVQPSFLLSVESLVASLTRRCGALHRRGLLPLAPETFSGFGQWRWDDVVDALAHG